MSKIQKRAIFGRFLFVFWAAKLPDSSSVIGFRLTLILSINGFLFLRQKEPAPRYDWLRCFLKTD